MVLLVEETVSSYFSAPNKGGGQNNLESMPRLVELFYPPIYINQSWALFYQIQ